MSRVKVFSNGMEYGAWQMRNCERCVKYNAERFTGECDLDLAMGTAYIGDGTFEPEVAERLGYVEGVAFGPEKPGGGRDFAFTWDCPERVDRAGAADG